jgi:hypothetical protein
MIVFRRAHLWLWDTGSSTTSTREHGTYVHVQNNIQTLPNLCNSYFL